MAGGNLSPRQKMINLMYLIFIAMLALNMSKEVLSAFGLMNERLVESNESAEERNNNFVDNLKLKAEEQPEKYEPLKADAEKLHKLAKDFDSYLAELKGKMTATVDNPTDYEIMDKGDYLDQNFFKGAKLKDDGQKFLDHINGFREGVISLLSGKKGMESIIAGVKDKFNTDPVKRGAGTVEWLDHNYKGFPLVASLTKMTQIQADIKTTESEVLSNMLKGTLTDEVSMKNYATLMETSKSAYFNGEQFDGEIVLGRTDASTKPNRVELTLDGRKLVENKDFTIEGGKVKLKVGTGGVGEHKISGNLYFSQEGEEVVVEVKQSFATVSKPNSATISADKMNVVYRGVKNPMTISFAGIPDNRVTASAQGLSRAGGSTYVMDATQIKGREVTINVTGKLPDGKPVSDRATFRIKDLPKPTGTVRGEDGAIKMQKGSLKISTIGAKFDDFDFELPLRVTGFKFKVPGQPTINVKGNKLDSRSQAILAKAKRGSDVTIFDIEAKASGVSVILKKVSPIIIELTN
ncbi:gliding motility protein GldM [Thalassobellus suaedae]|uniref:Gliding motility protein GldM n=1 Tax=Thalassobellus suaedae TaxID=3074124 RepID=A0ABY9XZM3_9FLAO|nr:gliding motility protein GldM [Flavobacteriaceae bacterium HL-DH14]WNH11138.1 gliding motility protein GldM [Flavobacteriaceae bacterium HL-DH10]